ncbi:hypothetical protein N431DRAFT_96141 [Stipitochalara longipes BDJ]|nr:hypothetical protein N431DRAFT_96141 [Stipitochalara longipes BDJ]
MASAPEPKFTLFPGLPKEIRLTIWNFALPGPRIVSLRQERLRKTIGEWEIEKKRKWPMPEPSYEREGLWAALNIPIPIDTGNEEIEDLNPNFGYRILQRFKVENPRTYRDTGAIPIGMLIS